MSNFIPNETIKVRPRDPPWINKTIKTRLNKQNIIFKNYKKHGYNDADKIRLDIFATNVSKLLKKQKRIIGHRLAMTLPILKLVKKRTGN